MKLKEFSESVRESMATIHQSESLLATLGPTTTDTDAMDTSNIVQELNKQTTSGADELVELQDSELCTLIDSLISGSIPL